MRPVLFTMACLLTLAVAGSVLAMAADREPPSPAAGQESSMPVPGFADYPAELSALTLRRVDLDSHPGATAFRSRLEALAGRSANFAGHYIVQSWGCGTSCQQFVIVDVKSGRVFMEEDWITSLGVCHRSDSSLLIANPGALAPGRIESLYYQWDGSQLKLLWRGVAPPIAGCELVD